MFCFTPDRSQCGSRKEIHCTTVHQTLPHHHHEHCCLCCVCVLAGGITLFVMFSSFSEASVPPFITSPPPKKKQRSVHTFSQPSYFQSARNAGAETNCAQLGHDHFTGKCRPEPSQCTAICGDRSNFVPMLPPLFTTRPAAGWLVETITTFWPLAFHGNFPPPRRHIYTVGCGLTATSNLTPFTAAWWQTRHRWTQWRRPRWLPPTLQVALFFIVYCGDNFISSDKI